MIKKLLVASLLLSSRAFASFDEPECLKGNVDFWEAVYTQYDEDMAIVFETDSMDVVKIVTQLPAEPKARKRALKAIRSAYGDADVRVQTGIKTRFAEGLERYAKYRNVVYAELRKQRLPLEIAALPHVESSYNPLARSKVGARGMWQVMPATARLMGFSPKRLHEPAYSTRVGVSILSTNFETLRSWPLAITAYNHGLNGVQRAVRETGSTDICRIIASYDGPRFGVSSRNFYASFLAVLRILKARGLADDGDRKDTGAR